MTGSSLAGIFTAVATVITAGSLWFAAMPAFIKMRREQREERAAAVLSLAAAAEAQRRIEGKIDIVHTLTNATLSVAKLAEVNAKKRELLMMREVGRLHSDAGREPSPEWTASIADLEREIDQLTQEAAERAKQTVAANLQIDALPDAPNSQ
jgi:hypothetical protein